MAFGADMDQWAPEPSDNASTGELGLVERKVQRTYLGLSWPEVKLLIIAGIGFLMDAYDLFVINMVIPILLLAYYPAGTKHIPWGLDGGVLKAAANIGNVFGQILFGSLGDLLGRSSVYGKELVIVIISVILMISVPSTPHFSGNAITGWITAFRFLMGIGIGGDYPMSAAIVSDRARLKNRGMLLAIIFSNQGLGNLLGGVAAVAVVAAYKGPVSAGDVHKLDGAWRILQGLSLVPAFGVIYYRFTLVESTRFQRARALQDVPSSREEQSEGKSEKEGKVLEQASIQERNHAAPNKPGRGEFVTYFSEWRHLRLLIGTCLTWFLVDITFYGIALNQSAILSAIGFTQGSTWGKLMKTATGNLIITSAGFLPGYWITIGLVEVLGRKTIQLIGFAGNAIFLAILAAHYDTLKNKTAPFFVVFVLLQLFFNFGANATTFIIPGEVFPTRVRSTAHGLSAACGKLGAIIASLGFAELSKPSSIGNKGVFWVFTGISVLGFVVTVLFTVETKGRDADLVDREEITGRSVGGEISPSRPDEMVCKRIIALEGDIVRVRAQGAGQFPSESEFTRPRARIPGSVPSPSSASQNPEEDDDDDDSLFHATRRRRRGKGVNGREWKLVRIPAHHAWVEGDASASAPSSSSARSGSSLEGGWSMGKSRDSREYGPVSLSLLTARVEYILFPFSRIGRPGRRSDLDLVGQELELDVESVDSKGGRRRTNTTVLLSRTGSRSTSASASASASLGGGEAHPDDSCLSPYVVDGSSLASEAVRYAPG
ncbi:unnamed protein product [Tilletia caries]|uniref:Major facilitator superfamily (MFS) profile domain-containing protein n=1 Tax=Tilletia caries TaxID=13290 RepID=A0ABN7IVH6_9BASI|nr:unnamed protein product [Tilletia controversa]CAD6921986.1 unnamed protein product [Tilletia caries]CAD6954916.1 unnamed protein product [Tilletia caries]CAD7069533.1 unnamed protein product [Tilletia caries]